MPLTAEQKAANQLADPNLETHCGCGVPFTMDCDTCKEYLGDQYHGPNEPLRPEWAAKKKEYLESQKS